MKFNFEYKRFREPNDNETYDNYFRELAEHIQNETERCLKKYIAFQNIKEGLL